MGCCLSVHGGSYPDLGFHDLNIFAAIHAMGHPFGIMISFMGMLFNGVFDRFPNVRYGFMEGGVSWFLMALERGEGSYNAFTPLDPNRRFLQLRDGDSVRDYILRLVHDGRIFVGVEGDEPDLAPRRADDRQRPVHLVERLPARGDGGDVRAGDPGTRRERRGAGRRPGGDPLEERRADVRSALARSGVGEGARFLPSQERRS